MNRRSFLAAAASSVAVDFAVPAKRAIPFAGGNRRKVIVVGGGLAGLSCAYELRKYGYDVVLLEGQERAGGRVQTLRKGLDPELTAEAGATRIPDTHRLTLSYVHEFGLPLEPFHGGTLDDVVHLRGRNYSVGHAPEPNWQLDLSAEERHLGRRGLAERYLREPLERARGLENSPNVPWSILQQDGSTLYEYLSKQGLSPAAIELLTVGVDTTISAALLLLVEFNEQISRRYYHIRGGNDQLPHALARRLNGVINYGSRVISIGQDGSSAWAVLKHADGHKLVRADYLVSALPFSVAANLFADARLSPEKQRVIRELRYFPVDKVFLQMCRQFWRANGQNGFANTDLLSERFWALGPSSPNRRGLLLSYVIGSNAAKLDQMDLMSRVEQTLSDAETVFPGARQHFEAFISKSWCQDPWQRGGLSAFGPGELNFIPIGARREGRIFFAGEHTSRWNGWMQGAIESAHRVVEEIRN
jgi:monoamine oxidase